VYTKKESGHVYTKKESGHVYAKKESGHVYAKKESGHVYAKKESGHVYVYITRRPIHAILFCFQKQAMHILLPVFFFLQIFTDKIRVLFFLMIKIYHPDILFPV